MHFSLPAPNRLKSQRKQCAPSKEAYFYFVTYSRTSVSVRKNTRPAQSSRTHDRGRVFDRVKYTVSRNDYSFRRFSGRFTKIGIIKKWLYRTGEGGGVEFGSSIESVSKLPNAINCKRTVGAGGIAVIYRVYV